jgi:hypothetical protein
MSEGRTADIRDWVAAKWRWNLSVNTAEKTAISGVLQGCPRTTVTVSRDRIVLPTPPPPPSNCHSSYPTVSIPPPPPDLDCGDVRFDNFAVRRLTRTGSTATTTVWAARARSGGRRWA